MCEGYGRVVCVCVCLSVCVCVCVLHATRYTVCLNLSFPKKICSRDMAPFTVLPTWSSFYNLNSHRDASTWAHNVSGRSNTAYEIASTHTTCS